TFSVVLRDPAPRFVAGTIRVVEGGWRAEFIDEESLSAPWTPPATAALTADQARGLVQDMCAARGEKDAALKTMGESLKAAQAQPANGGALTFKKGQDFQGTIDLKSRTFTLTQTAGDAT